MKNKRTIIGFILGVIIALIALFIFSKVYPEEDIAGIVIMTSLIGGFIFAFIGYLFEKPEVKK